MIEFPPDVPRTRPSSWQSEVTVGTRTRYLRPQHLREFCVAVTIRPRVERFDMTPYLGLSPRLLTQKSNAERLEHEVDSTGES